MTPIRFPSRIRLLLMLLMLTSMNVAHGKAMKPRRIKGRSTEKKGDSCRSQEEIGQFPNSVRVDIHVVNVHPDQVNGRSPVRNRSLSPWDYSTNEDPNRFPHVIAEASCRHHVCVDVSGKKLNYGMSSVAIKQEILVLKRKQMNCRQIYWLEKQVISVGCTCAFPATHLIKEE